VIERTQSRHHRILIVDDLPGERDAIRTAIEAIAPGCEFVDAATFGEAERCLREDLIPFDLAIVDIRLAHDEEGLNLIRGKDAAFQKRRQIPVIFYTAYPTVKSACEAYEAGASAYLPKLETTTEQFQEKVKELLERRKEREEAPRQMEAQRIADEEFELHRKDWVRRYGGKFLLFNAKTKQIVAEHDNPIELGEELDKYDRETRLDIAILQVPLWEE